MVHYLDKCAQLYNEKNWKNNYKVESEIISFITKTSESHRHCPAIAY